MKCISLNSPPQGTLDRPMGRLPKPATETDWIWVTVQSGWVVVQLPGEAIMNQPMLAEPRASAGTPGHRPPDRVRFCLRQYLLPAVTRLPSVVTPNLA